MKEERYCWRWHVCSYCGFLHDFEYIRVSSLTCGQICPQCDCCSCHWIETWDWLELPIVEERYE
jgi:hypothetical protein